MPSRNGERDQPPERGVDAAEIPEVGLGAARRRRTSGSGRSPPGARRASQSPVAAARSSAASPGQRHADRAHRGVAAEDRGVAAGVGARARRCGEDARRREIALRGARSTARGSVSTSARSVARDRSRVASSGGSRWRSAPGKRASARASGSVPSSTASVSPVSAFARRAPARQESDVGDRVAPRGLAHRQRTRREPERGEETARDDDQRAAARAAARTRWRARDFAPVSATG